MLSEKPWKLDQMLLMLLGMICCFYFFSMLRVIVLHFAGVAKLDENSPLYLLLFTLNIHGPILIATGMFLWWHRLTLRSAFGFRASGAGRAIFYGLLSGMLFLPVGMLLQSISMALIPRLGLPMPRQEAVVVLQNATSLFSRLYLSGFTIIIAPVAEEVLFRGLIYSTIKQCGYPRTALWGSSILFAAMHTNLPIFLPLTVLGMVLAVLYEKTDNLLAPIAAHGVFNAINVAGLYLLNQRQGPY